MPEKKIDNKTLILKIEKAMKDLDIDISVFPQICADTAREAELYITQVLFEYADANRKIVLDDGRGSSDLQTLIEGISDKRVKFLEEVISKTIEKINSTIASPLWFGDHDSFNNQIDKIRKNVSTIKSESDDNIEVANKLRKELSTAAETIKRLERTNRREQFRFPFKVLIWGVPIVAGIFISDKFSMILNFLFVFLLIAIAVGSYLMLRIFKFDEPTKSNFSINIRILKRFSDRVFPPFFIALLGFFVLFIIMLPIDKHFARKPLVLTIGSFQNEVIKNDKFKIPFSIKYTKSELIYDVSLSVSAGGLEVENSETKFHAIGNEERKGQIVIFVPKDVPNGKYLVDISCSFKGGYSINLPAIRESARDFKTVKKYTSVSVK